MVRSRAVGYGLASLLVLSVLVGTSPAQAAATVNGFDPPTYSVGQSVGSAPGVTFGASAVVYTPPPGQTSSAPQALKSSQSGCTNAQCPTGANVLDMSFPAGLDGVSMSVGAANSGGELCFPEGTDCAVWARLVAFDSLGAVVADSRDVLVSAFSVSGPQPASVVTPVAVTDTFGRIRSATLTLGEALFDVGHEGNPAPFAIDDLRLSTPDVPPPPPPPPTPPTITITAPPAGSVVGYPYSTALTGSVSPVAEVSSFCVRLNAPVPPAPADCRQGGLLDGSGAFSVPLADLHPGPGSNTAYVFAYNLAGQLGSASRPFSTNTPPPPSVVIQSPQQGLVYTSPSDVGLATRLTAPGRIAGYCYRVNDPAVPAPSSCTQAAPPPQRTEYVSFDLIPAAALGHGQNTIYVTLYDAFGQMARAQVTITRPTNIRIAGVEVTQGIQTRVGFVQPQYVGLGLVATAAGLPGPGVFTRNHDYAGTRMILGGQTVVRVFVNHDGLGQLPATGVSVLVSGAVPRSNGSLRPIGAVVIPDFAPTGLAAGLPGLTDTIRGDQRAAYTFTLPRSWHDEIAQAPGGWVDLRVKVSTNGITSVAQCPGCAADDEIDIHHITMNPTQMATPVHPVAVTFTDSAGAFHAPASPATVFAQVEDVAPHTQDGFTVLPYIGTVDVTDIIADRTAGTIDGGQTTEAIFGRVAAFGNGVNPPNRRIIGVMAAGISVRGVEKPVTYCCDFKPFPLPRWEPIAIAEEDRPLQSLLHEHFHQYGFYHAGIFCPGVQLATNWPPDNKGELQGFGLDRRASRRASDLSYRLLTPTAAQPLHDVMSYCATTEDDTWISPFNWNRVGNPFPNGVIPDQVWLGQSTATVGGVDGSGLRGAQDDPGGTLLPAHGGRGVLTISATVDADDRVGTFQAQFEPGQSYAYHPKKSPYRAVVFGRGGRVVARTLLYAPPGASSTGLVRGLQAAVDVPTQVRRIVLFHGSAKLASRRVSAHAPRVRLLSPTTKSRLRGHGTVLVRWQASDPDGNRLAIRLEYARNGKKFRTLAVGLHGNRARVAASLLTRSPRARLRVVVNDGYHESSDVSQRLRTRGPSSSMRIVSPEPKSHWRSGTLIPFIAQAIDTAGHPTKKPRLRWFVDGKKVATGADAQRRLDPGRHVIRVVSAATGDAERVVIFVSP